MQPLVTEDYDVTITPQGPWSPNKNNFTFTEVLSSTCKAESGSGMKKLLTGAVLAWVVSPGCTLPGANHVSGGSVSPIQPGSTKCKADGQNCMILYDKGQCAGSFTMATPPFTPIPCSCQVMITKTGQNDKTKGN